MDTTPTILGPLTIIYQDDHLVAINKPCGLLTHRSNIAKYAECHALQMLRDQINCYVYPAHRLDRKTSGVLLFSLNQDVARKVQLGFQNYMFAKKYIAIVRGYFPDFLELDYPLKNDDGKVQEAVTIFKNLKSSELEYESDRYPTSRYSLIEANPKTGRMHQIRKHCSHLNHPIIGDRPHGCNKQNRFFKEKYNMTSMMLHASEIKFKHPVYSNSVSIVANPGIEFNRIQEELDLVLK